MIINIILGIAGLVLGAKFADIDVAPILPVKHRSAWTHGPLVPLGLLFFLTKYPDAWSFAACFLGANSFHLMCDMFPGKWRGSALVNFYPVPLALPSIFSFLFLSGSMGYSLWVAMQIAGIWIF